MTRNELQKMKDKYLIVVNYSRNYCIKKDHIKIFNSLKKDPHIFALELYKNNVRIKLFEKEVVNYANMSLIPEHYCTNCGRFLEWTPTNKKKFCSWKCGYQYNKKKKEDRKLELKNLEVKNEKKD